MSPIQKHLTEFSTGDPNRPITLFTDSSWQYCLDDSRSTGCWLKYIQGCYVRVGSFVPTPVAMSSDEAEYNALAYGMQQVVNIRQLILELNGLDFDVTLSILVYCDSASAIVIGSSFKDTKITRHITVGPLRGAQTALTCGQRRAHGRQSCTDGGR